MPDEAREWVAALANQPQSRGGGQKKATMVSAGKTEPESTGSVGKRKVKSGSSTRRKSRRGKAKDKWDSDENDEDAEDEEEEEEEEEKEEEEGGREEEVEEKDDESDVEMENVDIKARNKGKGRVKAKPKIQVKTSTVKSKSKSKEDEVLRVREAKGLRMSARTRAKVICVFLRPLFLFCTEGLLYYCVLRCKRPGNDREWKQVEMKIELMIMTMMIFSLSLLFRSRIFFKKLWIMCILGVCLGVLYHILFRKIHYHYFECVRTCLVL